MSLVGLIKTVAVAGTAEPLATVNTWVDQLTFQGIVQAGEVYIGGSNVSSTVNGFKIPPLTGDNTPVSITYRGKINLADVYVDVETGTQGVAVSYVPSVKNSPY